MPVRRSAVELEGRWGFARGVNGLLQSLIAQGRADEAARTLYAELGEGTLADVPPMLGLMLTRARVWAACGDHPRALAEFDEAVRRRQKWGGVTPSWIGDLLAAAESHHVLGRPDEGAPLLVQARALADRWGVPGPLGQVVRAQAMLGSDGDRTELLREAVALLERSPARLSSPGRSSTSVVRCGAPGTGATPAHRSVAGMTWPAGAVPTPSPNSPARNSPPAAFASAATGSPAPSH